jgi:hypothetical protein
LKMKMQVEQNFKELNYNGYFKVKIKKRTRLVVG